MKIACPKQFSKTEMVKKHYKSAQSSCVQLKIKRQLIEKFRINTRNRKNNFYKWYEQ